MLTWKSLLSPRALDAASRLVARVDTELASGRTIYPPRPQIFRALELTPPDTVRCVILGQDPYFNAGQANGLAFSVNPGVPLPPSLRNIFLELSNDIGCAVPKSGDLTAWAERGVLLLNTALTVEAGKPNSHANWGWDIVVSDILRVCAERPQPVVFLLWGGNARAFAAGLQFNSRPNKAEFFSSHPSPLGARKGNEVVPAFLGSRPFSGANRLLRTMGGEEIDWVL